MSVATTTTRYFFDVTDSTGLSVDDEGIEFGTQREAETEAAQSLAGFARDVDADRERSNMAIDVRTHAGRVFRVALIFESRSR